MLQFFCVGDKSEGNRYHQTPNLTIHSPASTSLRVENPRDFNLINYHEGKLFWVLIIVNVNSYNLSWIFSLGRHKIEVWCVGSVGALCRLTMMVVLIASVGILTATISSVLRVISGHLVVWLDNCSRQWIWAVGIRLLWLLLLMSFAAFMLSVWKLANEFKIYWPFSMTHLGWCSRSPLAGPNLLPLRLIS